VLSLAVRRHGARPNARAGFYVPSPLVQQVEKFQHFASNFLTAEPRLLEPFFGLCGRAAGSLDCVPAFNDFLVGSIKCEAEISPRQVQFIEQARRGAAGK